MPTASNHSATSLDSAAEPETKNLIRPPSRPRIVLKTSLSASRQLRLQQDARFLLLLPHPGRLDADADRPVVDLRLEPAVALRGERDLGPDLFEDARRTAHERRFDDGEVLHDPGQVAVDRGAEAELQLHRGQHLAQDVGHRQPQVLHVVGTQDVQGGNRFALVHPVVVHQPHALGPAGGAGRVDQGGQVLRAAVGDPLVDQVRLALQSRRAAGARARPTSGS